MTAIPAEYSSAALPYRPETSQKLGQVVSSTERLVPVATMAPLGFEAMVAIEPGLVQCLTSQSANGT